MDSASLYRSFLRRLDAPARAEWDGLQSEADPELRAEALLNFAWRRELAGDLEAALALYQETAEAPDAASAFRDQARGRMDAILGRGRSGARTEFLLRRFAEEAADPALLAAMGLAGAAFRVTRLATLSRLVASPGANLFTRGLGARAVAGLAGFAVEVPVFTLGGRLAHAALGRGQDWSGPALSRDLASSLLVLGGLKLAGYAGVSASRRLAGPGDAAGVSLLRAAFQQTAMLGGILLGHGLERWAGLRRPQDGATTLVDSLALLLQFHVAGRLSQAAFGPGFQAWECGLDLQAERLARESNPRRIRGGPGVPGLLPALAGAVTGIPQSPERPLGTEPLLAVSEPPPVPAAGLEGRGDGWSYSAAPTNRLRLYPQEVEGLLQQIEAKMRAPDYLAGDRASLLTKRPSAASVDRIWFQQIADLVKEVPYVQVRELDAESLTESLNPEESAPERSLLDRVLRSSGPAGEGGGVSRRVIELRFPRKHLQEALLTASSSEERSLTTISSAIEAQKVLNYRVHLVSEAGDEVVARLPSLSLFERLLQEALGAEAVQFHYVEGAIPRDDVMRLRAQRVTPVGLSRHQIVLGDLHDWVYPFAFTIHDAMFHGAVDAVAEPRLREFSGRLYEWLGRHGTGGAESLRNGLSDGDFGSAQKFGLSGAGPQIATAFHDALERIVREPDPYRRRVALRELHRISEELASLILPRNRPRRSMEEQERGFMAEFLGLQRRIRQIYRSPNIYYTPEMRPVVAEVERVKARPGYMEGSREELLAKRVNIFLADRLWFYQARDFAGRVPEVELRELDAAELLKANPQTGAEPDRAMIEGALAKLDRAAPEGAQHRKVLEFSFPVTSLFMEDHYGRDPSLRFLAVMPFVKFVEHHLQDRISLIHSPGEDRLVMRIPSLSLLEGLIQGVHGADRAQFHFVNGEIPRDEAMRLRGMRVNIVGLSGHSHYFSEFEGPIHPFSFAQHDAMEHAPREAGVERGMPEFASRLYFAMRDSFPDSRQRDQLLNNLSDLYFVDIPAPESGNLGTLFSRLLLRRLRESMRGSRDLDPAHVEPHWARVEAFAVAALRLGKSGFPELQAESRGFIKPLRWILAQARRHRAAAAGDLAP